MTDQRLAAQGMPRESLLPSYDDLPEAPRGGRSAWGLFGSQDSVGLLNVLTPSHAVAAAQLVELGEVFPLDARLDFYDPPMFGRTPFGVDTQVNPTGRSINDIYERWDPQASSQWDGLGHFGYDEGVFYNGATVEDILVRGRNTIGHWAQRGIAARGVLVDVYQDAQERGKGYCPGSPHVITVPDLTLAMEAQGVSLREGDILLIRTGFTEWYEAATPAERRNFVHLPDAMACGLEHSEDMARFLWNTHVVAVASDAPAVEVMPADPAPSAFPFGILHRVLIGLFGMPLGELWHLERLAQRCHELGRFEFLLTSAPLHAPGAVGSPANALAIL